MPGTTHERGGGNLAQQAVRRHARPSRQRAPNRSSLANILVETRNSPQLPRSFALLSCSCDRRAQGVKKKTDAYALASCFNSTLLSQTEKEASSSPALKEWHQETLLRQCHQDTLQLLVLKECLLALTHQGTLHGRCTRGARAFRKRPQIAKSIFQVHLHHYASCSHFPSHPKHMK